MTAKFIRFVSADHDPVTGIELGFFQIAYSLKRSGRLATHDQAELERLLRWLEDNLAIPDRFARSSNPHAHGKAISWFKPTATKHIRYAREIQTLFDRYDVASRMLTTLRPGYVIFEDDYQIAAVPFRKSDF